MADLELYFGELVVIVTSEVFLPLESNQIHFDEPTNIRC